MCGVGFLGSVSGGQAPYTLRYILSPVAGGTEVDLGSFSLPAPGAFVSPAGFLSALDGVNADFNVSITLSDSGTQTKLLPNQFVANVRSDCTPAGRSTTAALAYPGPFENAPQSDATGGFEPPTVDSEVSDSTNGATPTTPSSPPLATTGSNAPLLATTSLALMALGGVLMVASRREDREAR